MITVQVNYVSGMGNLNVIKFPELPVIGQVLDSTLMQHYFDVAFSAVVTRVIWLYSEEDGVYPLIVVK